MSQFIELGGDATLRIRIPRKLTTDWADLIREECFLKIVNHDHSGVNGLGKPLGAGSLGVGTVRGETILLFNNEWVQGKNALGVNTNLYRFNANDNLEIAVDIEGPTLIAPVITPVSSDPLSPVEGQLQVSDGTHRPAGIYTYVGGSWLASPNNITASNQGTGEGLFIQKTGDDLEFKSLKVGGELELDTSISNEIEVKTKPYNVTQIIEKTGTTKALDISSLINEGVRYLTLVDNASESGTNFFSLSDNLPYLKEGDSLFIRLISNNSLAIVLAFLFSEPLTGFLIDEVFINAGSGQDDVTFELVKVNGNLRLASSLTVKKGPYPSRTTDGLIGSIDGLNQGDMIDIEVDYELFSSSGLASIDIIMKSGTLEIGLKRISISGGTLDNITSIKNIPVFNPNTSIEVRAVNLNSAEIVTIRSLKVTKKPKTRDIDVAYFEQ